MDGLDEDFFKDLASFAKDGGASVAESRKRLEEMAALSAKRRKQSPG